MNSTTTTTIPTLRPWHIIPRYTASHHRLLLFDYDGTLTRIVPDPISATLLATTSRELNRLADDPQNEVWVISGRPCTFLEIYIGKVCPKLGLCAEHGAFMRYPDSLVWHDLTASEQWDWRAEVAARFEKIRKETPGSTVEVKRAALAWHYRRAEADLELVAKGARVVAHHLREFLNSRDWKADVVEGKRVIEVRARALNKGMIVDRLMSRPAKSWDFVACWGDDTTDEDMFRILENVSIAKNCVFSVKVGDGQEETSAEYIVAAPTDVQQCIEWMNAAPNQIAEKVV